MTAIELAATSENAFERDIRTDGRFPVLDPADSRIGVDLPHLLRLPDVSGHWLVADETDASSIFARKYADILGRSLRRSGAVLPADVVQPPSVTFVVPFHVSRLSDWLLEQRDWLSRRFGVVPPTGLIAARSAAELSRVLAKQLLQLSELDRNAQPMFVRSDIPANGHAAEQRSRFEPADGLHMRHHRGPLFVYAHSRPHCGKTIQKRPVVLCSSPTEGQGGICVDGSRCAFRRDRKVPLRELASTRFFFDGCATATLGLHDMGLPAHLNHAAAVFSGNVREFLGNLTITAVDDAEFDWFAALSLAGYPPAAIVETLNQRRVDKRRERDCSLVYFGDAANSAWPCDGLAIKQAALEGGAVTVDTGGLDLLVVAVPGPEIDPAAMEERVSLSVPAEFKGTVELAAFRGAGRAGGTIVLRGDLSACGTVSLKVDPPRAPRPTVGLRLISAIRELRCLEVLPAFRPFLRGAADRLETALVELTKARDAMRVHGTVAPTMADLLHLEETYLYRHDAEVLKAALQRAQRPWDVEDAYSRFDVPPPRLVRCMLCGGKASLVSMRSHASPKALRRQLECPRCFIVYTVPVWSVKARLLSPPRRSGRAIEVTFGLKNAGLTSKRLTVALHVDSSKRAADRPATLVKELHPGEHWRLDLRYECKSIPDNFRRSKLFIASEGTFGYFAVSRFF
jgi:hypothetical protein